MSLTNVYDNSPLNTKQRPIHLSFRNPNIQYKQPTTFIKTHSQQPQQSRMLSKPILEPTVRVTRSQVFKKHFKLRGISILCIINANEIYVARSQILALMAQDSTTYRNVAKTIKTKTAEELVATSPNIDRKTLFIEFDEAMKLLTNDVIAMNISNKEKTSAIKRMFLRHKNVLRLTEYATKLPIVDVKVPKQLQDLSIINIGLQEKHQTCESDSESESLVESDSDSVESIKYTANKRRKVKKNVIDSSDLADSNDDDPDTSSQDKQNTSPPNNSIFIDCDIRESDDRVTVQRKTLSIADLVMKDREEVAVESFLRLMSDASDSQFAKKHTIDLPIQEPHQIMSEISMVTNDNVKQTQSVKHDKIWLLEQLVEKQAAYIKLQHQLLSYDTEIKKLRNDIMCDNI
jgi:hypothetical protein